MIFELWVLKDTHTHTKSKVDIKKERKNRKKIKCKPDNSQVILTDNKNELWCPRFYTEKRSSFLSYRFLPERALAAINRVQDIQFEAVIGHKIKMKWIHELQAEMYAP